ncbi:transaldolase family protein [Streptomyces sp. Je 1-332]|uniref:transaldolase family protein n=1 Tax=Streptomyces sp. Je 1-332 TaxID=3231270 RepID=UPI003459EC0C
MISQTAIGFTQRLAAEGVQSWLTPDPTAQAGASQLLPYAPVLTSGSVTGVALPGDAPPDLRAVAGLCGSLGGRTAPHGGPDGHVSAPLDPELAHDRAGLVSAALELRAAVGRDNLLVQIPATDSGIEAVTDCLAEGLPVDVTLICGTQQCERALGAFVAGMEQAMIAGHDLRRIRAVLSCPVDLIDTVATLPQDGAATAGVSVARLLYRLREQLLGGSWWRILRAARAQQPTFLWTGVRPHHTARLVGWNTGMTFAPAALEQAACQAELTGDTLLNRHLEAARELAALATAESARSAAGAVVEAELGRRRQAWGA